MPFTSKTRNADNSSAKQNVNTDMNKNAISIVKDNGFWIDL